MKHINEFTISQFRGIRDLKLEELGQINLLVGWNNSGKTSVLEALSIFCDPLNPLKWSSIASMRENNPIGFNSVTQSDRLLWLFPQGENVNFKTLPNSDNTDIILAASGTFPLKKLTAHLERFTEIVQVKVPKPGINEELIYEERDREVESVRIDVNANWGNGRKNSSKGILKVTHVFSDLGPLPRNSKQELEPLSVRSIHASSHRSGTTSSELWNEVLHAEMKLETIRLLQLFDPDIQDVDITLSQRRPTMSIRHKKLGLAPLSVFGDGLRRVFTLAAAIPGARDGLLLVDELETAIHALMLEKTFDWLVKACIQYNIQLFATTHSLEATDAMIATCSEGEYDLVVYRLQRANDLVTIKRFDRDSSKHLREDLGVDIRW